MRSEAYSREPSALAGLADPLVARAQKVHIGPQRLLTRHGNDLTVETLQTDFEHRTVCLTQNVMPDLDLQIGSNTQDVRVERGVVELAQSEAIRNDRFSKRMFVGQYVSCIQQLLVAQSAYGTGFVIGVQNPHAEERLMKPPGHQRGEVSPSWRICHTERRCSDR